MQAFTRALLEDVYSLERILSEGGIESGVRRIGAEQEIFLIDRGMCPSPIATEVLREANDPRLTTELARFNLEANLSPRHFRGRCLRELHEEIEEVLAIARKHAARHDSDVLLAGILPTLRKSDLTLASMTPNPRYAALNDIIMKERGGDLDLFIRGLDDLRISHDNVMLESCNTSFQLHLQVSAHEFAQMYNIAQAITAPVLAAAVNSPTLLRHRLWAETRVALFETSVDMRNEAHRENGHRPRVFFGDDWVRESALELFRDNISHFRTILLGDEEPSSSMDLDVPSLDALRLHSGTVYRWNRVCYGVSAGVPHLRIENRVLPAGPTVLDEVANAAFFFGLMMGMASAFERIQDRLPFDDVKTNFFRAANSGLDAQLRWLDGKVHPAVTLILEELLPMARDGLRRMDVDASDVDEYLGVLQERVLSGQTGSKWVFDSLAAMQSAGHSASEVRFRALTNAMLDGQATAEPVHRWTLAEVTEGAEAWRRSFSTVGQIMTTRVFSVRANDIIDLAANLMDWHHVRHVPVEDEAGRLIGIVSHRAIVRMFARERVTRSHPVLVEAVMHQDPVTAAAHTPTIQAMRLMKVNKVSCLPVVGTDGRLVGVVTEHDLMKVASRLLERFLPPDETP